MKYGVCVRWVYVLKAELYYILLRVKHSFMVFSCVYFVVLNGNSSSVHNATNLIGPYVWAVYSTENIYKKKYEIRVLSHCHRLSLAL